MTISFAGALLLSVSLLIIPATTSSFTYAGVFMFVVGLMFIEHIRRMRVVQLPWIMSVSWVLYRVLVLALISVR